jgi:electron transport complex protein RnfG
VENVRDILKPAAVLLVVCVVVSAALAFTYSITKVTIKERALLEAEEARREVQEAAERFEILDDFESLKEGRPELDVVKEAYTGFKGNDATGHVFAVVVKGYGGDLKMTVGIDLSGNITGVKIGENSETPGLGSKVTEDNFLVQFQGINPQNPLKVVKTEGTRPEEIDAVSGATISSRAVVSGVQAAAEASRLIRQDKAGG